MSIRTIRKAGEIVGHQAIAGAGAAGNSAYFSVAKYGADEARKAAEVHDAMLNEGRPARVYPARWRNARGLPGLRLVYVDRVQGEPILYAVATWEQQGRPMNRQASTAKHGLLGAVERVMRQREKGIGQSLGLTPRQALNRMRAAL